MIFLYYSSIFLVISAFFASVLSIWPIVIVSLSCVAVVSVYVVIDQLHDINLSLKKLTAELEKETT